MVSARAACPDEVQQRARTGGGSLRVGRAVEQPAERRSSRLPTRSATRFATGSAASQNGADESGGSAHESGLTGVQLMSPSWQHRVRSPTGCGSEHLLLSRQAEAEALPLNAGICTEMLHFFVAAQSAQQASWVITAGGPERCAISSPSQSCPGRKVQPPSTAATELSSITAEYAILRMALM